MTALLRNAPKRGGHRVSSGFRRMVLTSLLSPALPAGALLFGMVFCLAGAHLAGLSWQPPATVAFYGLLATWVAILAWRHRRAIPPLGIIDWLFMLFVCVVLGSAAVHGFSGAGLQKYGRYLPFLVVVPYVCGRLMRATDLQRLLLILTCAGLAVLPLLLIDYVWSPGIASASTRWPFFGYAHSALLIGMLLASAMVSLASYVTLQGTEFSALILTRNALPLGALGIVSIAVVLTGARGAAVAAVIGTTFLCLTAHWRRLPARFMVPLYVAGLVIASLMALPKPQAQFYGNVMSRPVVVLSGQARQEPGSSLAEGPILGQASCRPLEENNNSVAIRWVLYQEAIAVFLERPYLGVGPAQFGKYSCTGTLGFPHSTVLQGFAELGLAGGTLYFGLMAAAFLALAGTAYARTECYHRYAAWAALGLFATYLLADQIYGNYFMATGTYLLAGLAAGIQGEAGCHCKESGGGDE